MVIPEMVKIRPVIVVSPRYRHGLCTVVPISTVVPDKIKGWHYQLPTESLPTSLRVKDCWAKCDMITSVATSRLDRVRNNGKYVNFLIKEDDFAAIVAGIKLFFEL